MHPWEVRRVEREAQAAADTVARLEQALAVNAEEMDCRAEQLAEVRAAAEANRARMQAANDAGVRIVFDGSRREAEPLWERVPMAAVAAMESAIKDSDRLAVEESRLLGQVTNCERERDRLRQTLAHWTRVRDGLRGGLTALDGPEMVAVAAPPDFPTGSAPAVGTAEDETAERAEAVAAAAPGAHPTLPVQPAVSSSALNLRDRLAALSERVARW
jgi:hypothetical protein